MCLLLHYSSFYVSIVALHHFLCVYCCTTALSTCLLLHYVQCCLLVYCCTTVLSMCLLLHYGTFYVSIVALRYFLCVYCCTTALSTCLLLHYGTLYLSIVALRHFLLVYCCTVYSAVYLSIVGLRQFLYVCCWTTTLSTCQLLHSGTFYVSIVALWHFLLVYCCTVYSAVYLSIVILQCCLRVYDALWYVSFSVVYCSPYCLLRFASWFSRECFFSMYGFVFCWWTSFKINMSTYAK